MPFHDNGNPKPVILMGKNGSGKTLLISNIIHSIIEMKRRCFKEIPETDETNYFRLGTKEYIKSGTDYSYIKYLFTDDISLIDLATLDYEKIKDKEFDGVKIDNKSLKEDGFYQHVNVEPINKDNIERIFLENAFIYLPVDRYYSPNWLNNNNPKIKFNSNYEKYVGKNDDNIIKSNLLEDIESWLLDVIIDKMLYEERTLKQKSRNGNIEIEKDIKIYNGKNTRIQESINKLLTSILKLNNTNVISARIGISQKRGRKIKIIYSDGKNEYEYVPKFSNLSSGEVMILGMFIAILKEFDRVYNLGDITIDQLSGIVIIDEIDAHLHFDFCRLILPEMINMFPKIQFIISSHSPFFLLGMKEKFNINCDFVNMPSGYIGGIDNFEEIKKMYDLVENDYEEKAKQLKQYEEQIKHISKTIIITEGKTDWKHLKRAKEKLNIQDDFDFYESMDDMGDTAILNMLKAQAKIKNINKRIFIFDNDSEAIIKEVAGENGNYKTWGNNVYSFVIPKPGIRENEEKISIEHYYPDEVLKKEVLFENGIIRRIYCGNDFQKTGINIQLNKRCNKKEVCGENTIRVLSGSAQEKVYDLDNDDNNSTNYALTKDEFFERAINNNQYDIDMTKFNLIFDIIKEINEL